MVERLAMRNLAKSVLTFPWAVSMFGVQQISNLMSSPSTRSVADLTAALDDVTHATERHLAGWAEQTYAVGSAVQRGLIDTMMLKPPSIDSSAIMRSMAEQQSSPLFQAMLNYVAPPVAWLDSFLVSRRDSPAVLQEFANKLYIIQLVTQQHDVHDVSREASNEESLTALVDRAANTETFPRLWVVEGIGNYYGDRAFERTPGGDPHGLLTDSALAGLPPFSLTMLHAGIGMSFAKAVLKGLEPDTPAGMVRDAIARFVSLCRSSSRPGYAGAALESLGLATRTLYPNLVALMDREIPPVEPVLQGYFWHGVGRAMYFDPMNLLPSVNAPWRMIKRLDAETPHDLAYRNALSGMSWAIAVVNMRNPSVMEAFLRHHGALLAQHDIFTDGVTSALMMRYDTTRDDAMIDPFVHYAPDPAEPAAEWWRTLVTEPCEHALQVTYGELLSAGTLEELFHYRPGSR
jgi:hypothetical protein